MFGATAFGPRVIRRIPVLCCIQIQRSLIETVVDSKREWSSEDSFRNLRTCGMLFNVSRARNGAKPEIDS